MLYSISMANLSILDQFIGLGYDPDFFDHDTNRIGFNSKKYANTTIKIYYDLNDPPNQTYNYKVNYPEGNGWYTGELRIVLMLLCEKHCIVPAFPTKGVFDEADKDQK